MYRVKHVGDGWFEVRHPDGYWIGPGLGEFRSIGDALDWLSKVYFPRRK